MVQPFKSKTPDYDIILETSDLPELALILRFDLVEELETAKS